MKAWLGFLGAILKETELPLRHALGSFHLFEFEADQHGPLFGHRCSPRVTPLQINMHPLAVFLNWTFFLADPFEFYVKMRKMRRCGVPEFPSGA